MSESQRPVQRERESGPAEEPESRSRASEVQSWDEILVTREDSNLPAPAGPADDAGERRRARRAIWFKAALPFLVLALYGGFKYFDVMSERLPAGFGTVAQREPRSLSGIAPLPFADTRLSRDQRDFVAQLEALYGRGDWAEVIERVDAHPSPETRSHPVVRGLVAVSEARLGVRSVGLEERLGRLEGELEPAARQHPELLHELRVARAEQLLFRASDLNSLQRNTDLILRLLGPESRTPYDVEVRVAGARLYEQFGDALVEEGTGWAGGLVGTDTLKIRTGRSAYQAALRLVVPPGDWYRLEAISPRARPVVERLVEKIRQANRAIHGPSLPLTGSDSNTWDGRRGSPVHDSPPRRGN